MADIEKHDKHNTVRHLVHSHAHEEDIPGTVNLQASGTFDASRPRVVYNGRLY